jgi:hypothetical protein
MGGPAPNAGLRPTLLAARIGSDIADDFNLGSRGHRDTPPRRGRSVLKSSCRCPEAGDVPRKVFWCILPTG